MYVYKQLYKLADVAYIINTYVGVGPSTLSFFFLQRTKTHKKRLTQSTQSNQMFSQINVFAKQTEQSIHVCITTDENKHSHMRTRESFYFRIAFQDLQNKHRYKQRKRNMISLFSERERKAWASATALMRTCVLWRKISISEIDRLKSSVRIKCFCVWNR